MFIRKRGNSHQLIETYRVGAHVRQRIVANLGRYSSIKEAMEAEPDRFAHILSIGIDDDEQEEQPAKNLTGDDARRAAFWDMIARLIDLAALVSTKRKRDDIEHLFERIYLDELPMPRGLTGREFARAGRQFMEWLVPFLDEIDPPRGRRLSRAARWQQAVDGAVSLLEDLKTIQEQVQSSLDAIPEDLQANQPGTAAKVEALQEMDIDAAIDAVQELADVDMPRFFGKDE